MNKIFRIIWIVGVYVLLLFILYIVIIYKVKWEYKDKYMYFYNCDEKICTTTMEVKDYYSKLKCEEKCPEILESLGNGEVKINYNNRIMIYNYEKGILKSETGEE